MRVPRFIEWRIWKLVRYLVIYGIAAGALWMCSDRASAAEVGNHGATPGTIISAANQIVGLTLTVPEDGTVTDVWVFVRYTNAVSTPCVKAGLYEGTTLLGDAPELCASAVVDAWRQFTLSTPVVVTAGQVVRPVAWYGSGTSTRRFGHSGATLTNAVNKNLTYGAWPNPISWGSTSALNNWLIYVEYTPAPPPPPPVSGNGREGWFLLLALMLVGVVLFGAEAG